MFLPFHLLFFLEVLLLIYQPLKLSLILFLRSKFLFNTNTESIKTFNSNINCFLEDKLKS